LTVLVRAFGVGCAKTGTHSLAAMYARALATAHEPVAGKLIGLILDRDAGKISQAEFETDVARFFGAFDLDLNVSHVYGTIIDLLLRFYPEARFILTTRDCRSWLRSCVNFHVVTGSLKNTTPEWLAFRDFTFGPERFAHRPEDAPLREAGLYSLDSYLSYWALHNARVIATVPREQLLIVPMASLPRQAERIAAFLGASPRSADLTRSHVHVSPQVATPLAALDRDYVAERLAYYERNLLDAARARLPEDLAALAIGRGKPQRHE